MPQTCSKCNTQLQSGWRFCPGCALAVPHEPPVPHPVEPTPVRSAFSGLLIGLILTPVCLIVGIMLCLTGLGVFFGVPLIILGLLAPLLGSIVGFRSLRGNCPWCGAPLSSLDSTQPFDCDVCHRTIAIRDHKYVAAA
jgi:hypothetical protein